ncbi:MAG: hypothetical protein IKT57_04795 [Clostridia bacterium]|nr:hypothetical protein [Clostridia bacterium]
MREFEADIGGDYADAPVSYGITNHSTVGLAVAEVQVMLKDSPMPAQDQHYFRIGT